ncbi:hypothetical protein M885DRAFT_508659 [Pelagophyceae sp. CCMP2097]|nr:hypothetical protein M885DRAFT_508659 [Pelagophyceae sp. CCMP2097]|mmetsp:Transcript_20799/g.70489  ORF Transcript_20799/g.70489 Transcript_20799/m.70489 type:complete len:459 (-) Transcript_20799:294-1670(-)
MAAILRFAKSRPFLFGVGFSGLKTSGSDLIVQKLVECREEIDWRRNLAFASFGFGYLGMVQYAIYVPFFSRIFPRAVPFATSTIAQKLRDPWGQATVVAQVFLDQCVHHPFLYFPTFYCIKELVMAKGTAPDFSRALASWQNNFWDDLRALWQIWVPVTLVNFAFSPLWMRIPVVASTSLVWTMVLSSMRGSDKPLVRRGTHVEGVDDKLDIVLDPGEEDVILGGHVSARTMELFARGLARRAFAAPQAVGAAAAAAAADAEAHLCVVCHGEDRVGLVSLLTRWIYERGGNITGSKMLRMHDEFSIILHVTAPNARAAHVLRKELLAPECRPGALGALAIQARELGGGAAAHGAGREARLRLTGADSPGIVFSVTKMLSAHGLNIDELATDTVPIEADDGSVKPWFLLECYATATEALRGDAALGRLDADLDKLRKDLGVTIDLTWTGDDAGAIPPTP